MRMGPNAKFHKLLTLSKLTWVKPSTTGLDPQKATATWNLKSLQRQSSKKVLEIQSMVSQSLEEVRQKW